MRDNYLPDARTINWNVDANGNWSTASNWTPQNVAGGYNKDASFSITFTAARIATVNDHVTLRNLTIVMGSANDITIGFTTGKKIYFKSKTNCTISVSGSGVNPSISSSGETVLESDIIVDNATRFDWGALVSGTITTFEKKGAGQFNLTNNSNTFIATIKITAGTVQVGGSNGSLGNTSNSIEMAGGTLSIAGLTVARDFNVTSSSNITSIGTVLSGNIVLGAQLTFSNSVELSNGVSGSGNLVLTSGTLKISNTHSGTGNISSGLGNRTLLVTGTISSTSGTITVLNVVGNSTINKAINIAGGASIQASDASNNPATLTLGNNLVMGGAGSSTSVRTSGSSVSKINITGNYTARGTVDFPDTSLNTGTYDIVTYTGTLTTTSFANGTGNIGTNNTGKTININIDTVNKKIQIIVT